MGNDLRSKIIRLAHTNPALRPHLLPLLREAAPAPPFETSATARFITTNHAKFVRGTSSPGKVALGIFRGKNISVSVDHGETQGGLGASWTNKGWRIISSTGGWKQSKPVVSDIEMVEVLKSMIAAA